VQAKAIFDQQAGSGGLTGFKVGDAVSAATQAADSLAAAQGQLSQALGGLAGKLPSGTDLNSLTASLGTTGLPGIGQLSSALTGSIPGIASTITGASAGINSLVTGATSQLTGGLSAVTGLVNQLPAAIGALTGQAAQIGSLANQAVTGISKAISGVPTNGINVADFAKQLPALGGISNLSLADVTGTLAQTSKLIGQASNQISNALGAGKFGFDASQLEKAGLVKPGTAAAFLAGGATDLVATLSSPTVWTGKSGVKSLDGLLSNTGLQDKVQQGLMKTGLAELKTLGLPVDSLKPQALAGLATNAAKSVTDTVKWAAGTATIPGLPNQPSIPGLPGDIQAKFDAAATNGAFAVNLTQGKIEPPVKQEVVVEPASNTVNTATVTAAAARVVGNDKVPTVTADSTTSSAKVAIQSWLNFTLEQSASLNVLEQKVISLISFGTSITQQEWNTINEEFQIIKATVNSRVTSLQTVAVEAVNSLEASAIKTNLIASAQAAQKLAKLLVEQAVRLKKLIADLANKISTVQTA
jgi:hypothetical protein